MQLVTDSVNKTQVSHSQPHHTIELERISGWFPGFVIIEHVVVASHSIWELVNGFAGKGPLIQTILLLRIARATS